jgi:hypothetical protein
MNTTRAASHKSPQQPKAAASPESTRNAPAAGGVHMDIRRLSLSGYTQVQQQRFMLALETSLTQLASEKNGWSSMPSRHLAHLDVVRPGASVEPEQAAQQLAQQLFGMQADSKGARRHG